MIKVKFTLPAYQKLKLYISNVDDEVGGLGYVKVKGQTLTVYDIVLLPQEVSAASTTLLQASIAKYLDNRIKNNLPIEDIHVWWHSHGLMGANWSAIDDQTIEDFNTEREDNNWLLSIVGSQAGEMVIRLDIFSPFRITLDELKWELDLSANPELRKAIKKEIKEKVKQISLPRFPFKLPKRKKGKKKKKVWNKKIKLPDGIYDARGNKIKNGQ